MWFLKTAPTFYVKISLKQTMVRIIHAAYLHTKIRGGIPLPSGYTSVCKFWVVVITLKYYDMTAKLLYLHDISVLLEGNSMIEPLGGLVQLEAQNAIISFDKSIKRRCICQTCILYCTMPR